VTLDDELGRAGVGRPGRPDGPFPGRIGRDVTDFRSSGGTSSPSTAESSTR
jgi:hypothetical protein